MNAEGRIKEDRALNPPTRTENHSTDKAKLASERKHEREEK
jgi:hypothetical protein